MVWCGVVWCVVRIKQHIEMTVPNLRTVGSSLNTSSPTSAVAMASLIPGLGLKKDIVNVMMTAVLSYLVMVSLLRSTTVGIFLTGGDTEIVPPIRGVNQAGQ